MKFCGISRALAGSLLFLSLASASPITLNFWSGSNQQTNPNPNTTLANSRTFTNGGVTVTVFGVTLLNATSNTTFTQSQVGRYSNGLGVCNSDESCGGSPAHTVDNGGGDFDFLLFVFNQPVDVSTVSVVWYNTSGGTTSTLGDVNYLVGNVTALSQVTGKKYSDFTGWQNVSDWSNTSVVNGGVGTSLLFGAEYPAGSAFDGFKLKSMVVSVTEGQTPVPEPSTYALMGTALLALGLLKRRMIG